jgi:hypothetical protein
MKNLSQERKRKKNAPMEYEDFAADILLTAKGSEKDAMAKAGASMLKGSTNAGRTAEMLAAKGLSESGYEDYVRSRVKLNAEKAVSSATESRLLSESRARGGYEEYISEYDKLQTKLGESVIKQLSTEPKPDRDAMYDFALSAGLGDERARMVAERAYEKAAANAIARVTAIAKENNLTAYRARLYALSEGLDEDAAEQVYNAVFTLKLDPQKHFENYTAEDYVEYIKRKVDAEKKVRSGKNVIKNDT